MIRKFHKLGSRYSLVNHLQKQLLDCTTKVFLAELPYQALPIDGLYDLPVQHSPTIVSANVKCSPPFVFTESSPELTS